MSFNPKNFALFGLVFGLILLTGFMESWAYAMGILNMGMISAIMALGVNIQWGYAGLFNVGIVGFVALGGLGAMLMSVAPVPEAWSAGGARVFGALAFGAAVLIAAVQVFKRMQAGRKRALVLAVVLVGGFFGFRALFDPAVLLIEAVDPSTSGYLGGFGMPITLGWVLGGMLAAGAAWLVGKTALGLRSDYLAIATLGIGEIIIAAMKNEEWLTRGVKNVTGLPRPVIVPYEVDLQADPAFVEKAAGWGMGAREASTVYVDFLYFALFGVVLLAFLVLAELALRSPWGRMMRAIRDNETAARAMGKDVTRRHLQIFVIGSAICGVAGAMLVTMDSLLTPTAYNPLRYTFLIWVMVIVGGSGNNWGSVLGGFLIWFIWTIAEARGPWLMDLVLSGADDNWWLKAHLLESAAHMRLFLMGVILLLVLRFSPRGLIPEK